MMINSAKAVVIFVALAVFCACQIFAEDYRGLIQKGNQRLQVNDVDGALATWNTALAEARNANDQRAIKGILVLLTGAYIKKGEYSETVNACSEALSEPLKDFAPEYNCMLQVYLGTAYISANRLSRALPLFEESLEGLKKFKATELLGAAYFQLVYLNMSLNHPDKAKEYYDDARKLFSANSMTEQLEKIASGWKDLQDTRAKRAAIPAEGLHFSEIPDEQYHYAFNVQSGDEGTVGRILLTPDGKYLLAAGLNLLKLWTKDGRLVVPVQIDVVTFPKLRLYGF
jgi:tetratricopeptide (TPR) repeat protein